MTSNHRSLQPLLIAFLALLAAFLIWFLPAFYRPVFHPDDITVFWHHLNWGVWRSNGGWVGNGRFLQWLIHAITMHGMEKLEDYVVLRWLGLLFGLFFGTVFINRLKRVKPWAPFVILLALFTTPSFAIYFIQTHFIDILLAGGFAMLSGHAFMEIWIQRKHYGWFLFTGISFAWISLHLHQTGIGFFLIPFVIKACEKNTPERTGLLLYSGITFVLLSAAYWVYFNLTMQWLTPGSFLGERGSLPTELSRRPGIFFRDYLYTALAGHQYFRLSSLHYLTAFLSVSLCCLSWYQLVVRGASLFHKILLWAALPAVLVLSIAPALASHQLFFSYRLSGPMIALLVLIIMLGGLHLHSCRSLWRWPLFSLFLVWGILYFGPSRWAIQEGQINAQADEYATLNELFQKEQLQNIAWKWHILFSSRYYGRPGMNHKMDFGTYNTAQEFSIINYFQILAETHYGKGAGWYIQFPLEKNGDGYPQYPINLVSLDYLFDPSSPVGQYPHQARPRQDPQLGTLFSFDGNRFFSPWLGWLEQDPNAGWVHSTLGPFSILQEVSGYYLMNFENLGRYWINPKFYPHAKNDDSGEWVNLLQR